MRGKDVVGRVTEAALRSGEPILQQPLLELCGEHRLLIEHHNGIGMYSSDGIDVKVRFGYINICGSNLEICRMTAEQLIIIGNIVSVTLLKGSGK